MQSDIRKSERRRRRMKRRCCCLCNDLAERGDTAGNFKIKA